ncbi:uncharacterized protein Z518_08457 [Rhinocladiella mackenziei CBS 650.93]|uniref:EKC/KEOPS complex subunit BUD32 n=1 Tax=Rhinocladiella mackenziei CBS 650.93 TaxID=1442369 RepID=A0A0D2IGX6_9EURO|nr:uncharacterized protein Z518_08457 [Rhinocladiella mackenziei CBS 650.93]KIX02516.1 hypothetical protein Z518_08457 [Rhinocladiella mackenziei CBS 650.93]
MASKNLASLKRSIEKFMYLSDDGDRQFITVERLGHVWPPNDDNGLRPFLASENGTPHSPEHIRSNFIVILSILVYIRPKLAFVQNALARFIEAGCTDDHLPLHEEHKVEKILGPLSSRENDVIKIFYKTQFIFKPIIIRDTRAATETILELSHKSRWPFLEDHEIARGSYGTVSRATVAKGCFQETNPSESEIGNLKDTYDIAYKKFCREKDGRRELKRLNYLKESIVEQKRITVHHAAFLKDNAMYLFLPYTPLGDLDVFLSEGRRKLDNTLSTDEPLYNFQHEFSNFSSLDLFTELGHLASALAFLHGGLQDKGLQTYCVHRDFRPRNILVFPGGLVGHWKITDFGISTFKIGTSDHDTSTETIGDIARQVALGSTGQDPGPNEYRAPELSNKETPRPPTCASDIWSFGAIASDVLAFALGHHRSQHGAEMVTSARHERTSPNQSHTAEFNITDDLFYEQRISKSTDGREIAFRLKPSFIRWLKKVTDSDPNDAAGFRTCTAIIRQTLKVAPDHRKSLEWARTRLGELWQKRIHESEDLQHLDFGTQFTDEENFVPFWTIPSDQTQIPDDPATGSPATHLVPPKVTDLDTSPDQAEPRKASKMSQVCDWVWGRIRKNFQTFALSPSGERACFVVMDGEQTRLEVFDVVVSERQSQSSGTLSEIQKIEMPPGLKWTDLHIAGQYITVRCESTAERKFYIYDIGRPGHSETSRSTFTGDGNVIPSKYGIFALWDLENLQIRTLDATSQPEKIYSKKEGDGNIRAAAFSVDGGALHLWTDQSLRVWYLQNGSGVCLKGKWPLQSKLSRGDRDILLPCGPESTCLFQPNTDRWRTILNKTDNWSCTAKDRHFVFVFSGSKESKWNVGTVDLEGTPLKLPVPNLPLRKKSTTIKEAKVALFETHNSDAIPPRIVLCNANKEIEIVDLDELHT